MIIIKTAILKRVVANLESKLADEEQAIADAMAPVMQDGKLRYFSPGDGYWKRRWVLENKLFVARKLLEEFGATEGKAL